MQHTFQINFVYWQTRIGDKNRHQFGVGRRVKVSDAFDLPPQLACVRNALLDDCRDLCQRVTAESLSELSRWDVLKDKVVVEVTSLKPGDHEIENEMILNCPVTLFETPVDGKTVDMCDFMSTAALQFIMALRAKA